MVDLQGKELLAKRAEVVAEALTWQQTKFGHRQRTKGGQVDCACFLAEVYERTGVLPHIDPPWYPADWCHHTKDEFYRDWILCYARKTDERAPGNIASFALHGIALEVVHTGIVVEWPMVIAAWPLVRSVKIINAEKQNHFKHALTGFFDPFVGPSL